MKKNFWKMAAVLVALAVGFASCGSSDDDVINNSGDNPGGNTEEEIELGDAVGTGTLVIDGKTYDITHGWMDYELPWGEEIGRYCISMCQSEMFEGKEWWTSVFDIYVAADHINGTFDWTKDLTSKDGKQGTYMCYDGYAYDSGQDFKSGTLCVMLNEAAGTFTIETSGVVHNSSEGKDITFSLTFTGKVNIRKNYGKKPAPDPEVPFGDGWFTGTGTYKLNGVTTNLDEANVSYVSGPTGEYEIGFYPGGSWLSSIDIPLNHVGVTCNLTDALKGTDGEITGLVLNDRYYYPSEGDFKSGTLYVAIDKDGNLTVTAKGVANSSWDEEDSDLSFEINYTGKGTVDKQ